MKILKKKINKDQFNELNFLNKKIKNKRKFSVNKKYKIKQKILIYSIIQMKTIKKLLIN